MTFTPMAIAGAWVHTPKVWADERGTFHEVFKLSSIAEQLGRNFSVKQVNQSLSNKGAIRGVHWTQGPVGQAKHVSCIQGAFWDVVVDLRQDSTTFGCWDAVIISESNKSSLLISEGLGHALLALEPNSIANYLCSEEYNPEFDRTLNPLSPNLAIPFESVAKQHGIEQFILSEKDSNADFF